MKSAFSLLELIFVIVILGVVASFAVPKFFDTKDSALISTIKRDLNTTVSSIQTYYLLNERIEKITDAVNINLSNWTLENEDRKLIDKNSCVSLEIVNSSIGGKSIKILVDTAKTTAICKKMQDAKIVTISYEL